MASNLSKRLDRLERLIRERTAASTLPLYLREGSPIPQGVDPERITFIARTFIDPPEREEEELPKVERQALPASEKRERTEERCRLEYPNLGIV
jgi:hypothetical protein